MSFFKNFFTTFLLAFMCLSTLKANSINPLQNNIPTVNNSKPDKLSYKEMIQYMKLSGDPGQIFSLGIIYLNGIKEPDSVGTVVEKDTAEALKYFNEAISKGYIQGYGIVGALFLYNENLNKLKGSLDSSKEYLKKAISHGDTSAYIYLSDLYSRENRIQDSIDTLMIAANLGDATAEFMVAIMYKEGVFNPDTKKQLIQKDMDKALYFLNKACSNQSKSEKIKKMCFNSDYVSVESKHNGGTE